jgi:hypothetical protein
MVGMMRGQVNESDRVGRGSKRLLAQNRLYSAPGLNRHEAEEEVLRCYREGPSEV